MSAKKKAGKPKTIGLHFGALCDPIKKQLAEQGFGQEPKVLTRWQEAADAVTRLSIMGVLAPSEVHKARQRLVKQVGQEAVPR